MKMLLAEPTWMRKDTVTADDRWEFCLRGRGTEHAGEEVVRLKRNSAKVEQNGRETELEEQRHVCATTLYSENQLE